MNSSKSKKTRRLEQTVQSGNDFKVTHCSVITGHWKIYRTSSFLLRSRKCRATCMGRMLCNRHSLCSRNSLMSSTSCWACRRHRKSSRAVASHLGRKVAHCSSVWLPTDSEETKKNWGGRWFSGNSCRSSNYLPSVVEDSNNKHCHEKNGNPFSSGVVGPVKVEGRKLPI